MPSEKNPFYVYAIPLAIVIFLIFIIFRSLNTPESTSPGLSMNEPFPQFDLPLLQNPTERLTNADLQGHVSLLNIWASWCAACRYEHSVLMEIKNQYHIPIYGVLYNDSPRAAKQQLAQAGNPYTAVAIDSQGLLTAKLGIEGIPITYIIDSQGKIRYHYLGAVTEDVWKTVLLPVIKLYQPSRDG